MAEPDAAHLPRLTLGDVSHAFPDRGGSVFVPLPRGGNGDPAAPDVERPGIWLFRAESGVCGVIPVGVELQRDGIPMAGMCLLHHGQRLDAGDGLAGVFEELWLERLEPGSRSIGRRCPACRTVLREGQAVIRCPLCSERYCQGCWEELANKRCYSRRCRFSLQPLTGKSS